jgi:hypothetical protein
VKLFQIEEPEGGDADPDAAGAAVGIDASGAVVAVAMSLGGNAAILPDREGFERVLLAPSAAGSAIEWHELLEAARLRAERALARPVTHAVVVLAAADDAAVVARIVAAAEQAGLALLRITDMAALPAGAAPALAAAALAEELMPWPDPGPDLDTR